ncbi:hypothetical protein M9458_018250, partial [Cirrhinus mrigala]
RMSIRIQPPTNAQERLARQQGLAALRQQGWEIGAFTQFFWMMSRGLDYDDTTLKEIFNSCLDDPVPKWEMENLKILNFWDFSKYIGHRIQWGMPPLPPKSTCSDHSATLPLSIQDQDHLLTPTQKRRARRRRALLSAASIDDSDTFSVTLDSTEIAPISPEPIKSSSVKPPPIKYALVPSESVELTSVSLVFAMNNPKSEPDKSSVIPQSSKLVPAQLKSVAITAVVSGDRDHCNCGYYRGGQAHNINLSKAEEGPSRRLSAPNPEILDDPILVPGPVTFSEPLTSQVMPSETVSTHPVMLPEAYCLSMPVMAKEVILKPASEEDVSKPANPAQVTSKMARLAAISSASVNSKPKSFSVIPELVNSATVIQEQVVPTTVITHSMMETPDISESAKSTSVFKESTKCTPVISSISQVYVVPQSIRTVSYLSRSAGSIPISAETTRVTACQPVLAELATDTTKVVKHAASICQKQRRMAHTVQSNTLPVLSTEAMFMNSVLSKGCVPASHVTATESFPELAVSPVRATEADVEVFILPVPVTEASSKQPVLPVTSKDAILTCHVKSKNAPANQEKSTEVTDNQVMSTEPTHTALTKKVSQASPIQPVMVKEAMSETPAVAVVSPKAAPEQPALSVLAMEAIPEALTQPVKATEAITEHPALPAIDMETIPKQPVVLAAEAFSETLASRLWSTREILAALAVATKCEIPETEPPEFALVQEPPEFAPVQEPPEFAPESAVPKPAPEKAVHEPTIERTVQEPAPAPERTVPESAPEKVVPEPTVERTVHEPAIEEAVPEPAPERAVTVSAPAPESVPVSAPAPEPASALAQAPVPGLMLASAPKELS